MGLSDLNVQDETDQSQRPHPAHSWAAAGAIGRGGTAGLQEPLLPHLRRPRFHPTLAWILCLVNVERIEDQFLFLSFFSF